MTVARKGEILFEPDVEPELREAYLRSAAAADAGIGWVCELVYRDDCSIDDYPI